MKRIAGPAFWITAPAGIRRATEEAEQGTRAAKYTEKERPAVRITRRAVAINTRRTSRPCFQDFPTSEPILGFKCHAPGLKNQQKPQCSSNVPLWRGSAAPLRQDQDPQKSLAARPNSSSNDTPERHSRTIYKRKNTAFSPTHVGISLCVCLCVWRGKRGAQFFAPIDPVGIRQRLPC